MAYWLNIYTLIILILASVILCLHEHFYSHMLQIIGFYICTNCNSELSRNIGFYICHGTSVLLSQSTCVVNKEGTT